MGLPLNLFITERGGQPDVIKKSQEARGAPVEVVDQIIEQFQAARSGL
jgi:seryl-tRNA synthetase